MSEKLQNEDNWKKCNETKSITRSEFKVQTDASSQLIRNNFIYYKCEWLIIRNLHNRKNSRKN